MDKKTSKKSYTLNDLQGLVEQQVIRRGGYWDLYEIIAKIIEEVSELSEVIMKQRKVPDDEKQPIHLFAEMIFNLGRLARSINGSRVKKADDKSTSIGKELADILYALICIANQLDIDLGKALVEKIGIAEIRDKKRYEKGAKNESQKN